MVEAVEGLQVVQHCLAMGSSVAVRSHPEPAQVLSEIPMTVTFSAAGNWNARVGCRRRWDWLWGNSGWSSTCWWDLVIGRPVGNWGWGFTRWWYLEMGRRGFPSWRDESQSRTVNVSRFFGMRLRVFGSCVHRLFSTVCARRRAERDSAQSRVVVLWPPRHSTVEAIVVTILCECISFSIPSFTAFCKGHGLSCHHT